MHHEVLVNDLAFDAIPASMARARSNSHARALSLSRWLIRRKRDGRYMAVVDARGTVTPWVTGSGNEAHALNRFVSRLNAGPSRSCTHVPIAGLQARLGRLGLDAEAYANESSLPLVPEPAHLTNAGRDRYRRPLWLEAGTAKAWSRLRRAARADDIVLEAISGFRGHDYQLGIFERKRARGIEVADILKVNAAPGFSEHHSGRALDISMPGEPAAEESFETTAAFEWLTRHAQTFGFRMSYPRNNPHGIVYEPWHWYFEGITAA